MSPEPMEFPAPRDPFIQDQIEAAAEQLRIEFPHRTLLACRQLAAALVDEIFIWDAMWPEAEGDCGCPDYLTQHQIDCLWRDAAVPL